MQVRLSHTHPKTAWLLRNWRFALILLAIIVLNSVYGFEPRFTIINLLWILISILKTDRP